MSALYHEIDQTIQKHVPIKSKGSKFPFWFSHELKTEINRKERAHRAWKKTSLTNDYQKFSELREKCKTLLEQCHEIYIDQLQNNLSKNIKLFWAYTKSKKQTNTYPNEFIFQQKNAADPNSISDMFSAYFQTTYTNHSTVFPLNHTANNASPTNNHQEITPQEVEEILSRLDENKNGGPDQLSNYFIKKVREHLAHPLSIIFNKSLKHGIFPNQFKYGYITPIYKKGDKNMIINYRPVCLLNTFSLVFEKLVLKNIRPIINRHICHQQHGFMPRRSTASNLNKYVSMIAETLDRGQEVHAIYTDFSKAFDTVDHGILIHKLKKIGLNANLIKWFISYVTNRKLSVIFGGAKSTSFSPKSGVPQGSVLGPILFTIFINDLGDDLKCEFLMFADDIKIFKVVGSRREEQELQNDLNTLSLWCRNNKMVLNVEKCHFMEFSNRIRQNTSRYYINDTELVKVEQIRDLGVVFDNKLKFDSHIDGIINKTYKMLGFISRLTKDFKKSDCLQMLYNTLVRSNLEYCTTVWSPNHELHILKLERIQKSYTRLLFFRLSKPNQTYDVRLKHLKMLSLGWRRLCFDMDLIHEVYHNVESSLYEQLSYRNPQHFHRHNHLFYPSYARTDFKFYHSPMIRAQRLHNKYFNLTDINKPKKYHKLKIRSKCIKLQSEINWNVAKLFKR